eukprot:9513719-Alexandrium_andersonii.AAC.1
MSRLWSQSRDFIVRAQGSGLRFAISSYWGCWTDLRGRAPGKALREQYQKPPSHVRGCSRPRQGCGGPP